MVVPRSALIEFGAVRVMRDGSPVVTVIVVVANNVVVTVALMMYVPDVVRLNIVNVAVPFWVVDVPFRVPFRLK